MAALVLADTAYDSGKFREFLVSRGSTPVIKPNPTRKNIPPFDKTAYKGRNVIERAFSHLKTGAGPPRDTTNWQGIFAPLSLSPFSSGGGFN
jgi:transposase